VLAVAASFDGRIIFSASRTSVAMWDLDAASEKLLLKRFAGGIPSLEFSPDGHLLASVSKDKSVTLWDPHTGQLVHNLIGCQGAVQALAFSPDGRWLATGDWSGEESVRIWDVASGHCLLAIDPKLPEVWSVAFSGDGRYFAIAAHPGWIIWKIEKEDGNENVQLGSIVHSVTTASTVTGVCFTADSSLLAWVERDLSFHLWNVEAARAVEPPLSRLGFFVNSVRLDTSDVGMPERGKWLWLWTGGWEIWDMASGRKVGPEVYPAEFETLPEDSKWGWCRAISPDQSRLAVGQADGSLELWDLTRVRARLIEAGLGWGQGHDPPPAAQ